MPSSKSETAKSSTDSDLPLPSYTFPDSLNSPTFDFADLSRFCGDWACTNYIWQATVVTQLCTVSRKLFKIRFYKQEVEIPHEQAYSADCRS